MQESQKKKLFNEIASKCEVNDFHNSNVSSMLQALAAVEQSQRLEKRKAHPILALWTWLKKIWTKILS